MTPMRIDFSPESRFAGLSKKENATYVKETLEKCVKEGINKNSLLAALNRVEFSCREADTGSMPKGLLFLFNMFNDWLYDDARVFDALKWTRIFNALREKSIRIILRTFFGMPFLKIKMQYFSSSIRRSDF